jgi:hypothetical protein
MSTAAAVTIVLKNGHTRAANIGFITSEAIMGKAKPNLVFNIEFEWNMHQKYRLKCCPDMERMSNTWDPFYFYDKH